MVQKNLSQEIRNFVETLSESNVKNHNFFNSLGEAQSYYLGMFACDGWLDPDTNRLEFSFEKQDSQVLTKLASLLGMPSSSVRSIGNSVKLRFKSEIMAKRLNSLGITSKKINHTIHRKMGNNKHFLRGMFDADGSINGESGIVQFGTPHKGFMDAMNRYIGSSTVRVINVDGFYRLKLQGDDAKRAAKKLYSSCSYFIPRKKKSAMSMK